MLHCPHTKRSLEPCCKKYFLNLDANLFIWALVESTTYCYCCFTLPFFFSGVWTCFSLPFFFSRVWTLWCIMAVLLTYEILDFTQVLPLLKGWIHSLVDVFVTLEDIPMYKIIVWCCSPIGDVFTPLRDVLIVPRPWGTTFVVSQGNSPHHNIM